MAATLARSTSNSFGILKWSSLSSGGNLLGWFISSFYSLGLFISTGIWSPLQCGYYYTNGYRYISNKSSSLRSDDVHFVHRSWWWFIYWSRWALANMHWSEATMHLLVLVMELLRVSGRHTLPFQDKVRHICVIPIRHLFIEWPIAWCGWLVVASAYPLPCLVLTA